MKHFFLTIAALFLINIAAEAQSNCSQYYPFTEGVTSQITTYDKRGRVAAIVDYTIANITGNVATFSMNMKDEDSETIAESEYDVTCMDNQISIDIKSMVSPQMMEQYANMEYDITGDNILLPNNLSVGMELPDATMKLAVSMSGINMNTFVSLKDRKVIGQEEVTTPAGTFDCMVISYTSEIKVGLAKQRTAKQWIAEGVGMVKQEDYNRSGRVVSSSLLTSFSE